MKEKFGIEKIWLIKGRILFVESIKKVDEVCRANRLDIALYNVEVTSILPFKENF